MGELKCEHELKTDPEVFQAVWRGEKSFEIRLDDRDFSVGDRVLLRETKFSGTDMKTGAPLQYTGLEVQAEITYKLSGPIYGLIAGWCILSINRRKPEPGQPAAVLCGDCPPADYPTDETRCIPCPRRAAGQSEPAAYRYRFTDPISGNPVWRNSHIEWNGQKPKESQALYTHPIPAAPAVPEIHDDVIRDWAGEEIDVLFHGLDQFAVANVIRSAINRADKYRAEMLEASPERQGGTPTCPIIALVQEQAEDEGLWFEAKTAPEAYLQQELRKLHAVIEQQGGAE